MSKSSGNAKLFMVVAAVSVLVAVGAVVAIMVKSQMSANSTETAVADGTGGSDGQASTASSRSGNGPRTTATLAQSTGGQAATGTVGGNVGGNSGSGGSAGGGGYVPGSVDISAELGEGRQQVPADFILAPRVAESLGFRRQVQEVAMPDKARELLRQYEFDNNRELLDLLTKSDAALNAAFQATLAAERPASSVTTEQARVELITKFAEHLELLYEINNGYYQVAQQHLDNRGKASMMHQFDQYVTREVLVPYTVPGTSKAAITLRGDPAKTRLEVIDGDKVYKYRQSDDGTTYVPLEEGPVE